MLVINFFESFFQGFGNVLQFVQTPIGTMAPYELARHFSDNFYNFTVLEALGISLGVTLVICFGLHLWHLVKLVF